MNDSYWSRVLNSRISRRRALAATGTLAAGAALLVACGGDDDGDGGGDSGDAGPAPSEIKIGAVVPLTGRYAAGGAQIKNGYEIAIDDINLTGGVQVKPFKTKIPLKLELLDDASDPNQTVQRLETLYSSNVLAYLGGFGSDLHAAAAPIAEKNKIPYLGVAFALYKIHQQGYKFLFSPFVKSPGISKSWFDLMDAQNPKPTKLAFFPEKTDWGAEMRDYWRKEASSRGYQVVVDEEYAPGATDLSPLILKAKSASADALLSLPSPPDGALLQRQLKELDYTPKITFIVRAADAPTWGTNFGKDGDYVIVAPGWSPDLKYDGVTQFNSKHQTKYGTPPGAVAGPAHVAVSVLADAISRAEKLDRDSIRDALTKTDLKSSLMGAVKFKEDGSGDVLNVSVQWQAGKLVSVWPKDIAGGTLQYPAKPFKER
ncbi:MAG TPA: amino acid ABC transporter substrate-binding protein [Dehalococcoidia bacterium]